MRFKRSAPVGMRSAAGLDGTRDVDGGVRPADQVCMAPDVATMFEDLPAMADVHADRARLQAELEQARRRWWHRWFKR
jgi:hypothetical protein